MLVGRDDTVASSMSGLVEGVSAAIGGKETREEGSGSWNLG